MNLRNYIYCEGKNKMNNFTIVSQIPYFDLNVENFKIFKDFSQCINMTYVYFYGF